MMLVSSSAVLAKARRRVRLVRVFQNQYSQPEYHIVGIVSDAAWLMDVLDSGTQIQPLGGMHAIENLARIFRAVDRERPESCRVHLGFDSRDTAVDVSGADGEAD